MKKEYPKRERSFEGIDWDDVCECGHGWEDHEIQLLKLFNFLRNGGKAMYGFCNKCKCPDYKLDKDNPSARRLSKSQNFTEVSKN